jgi:hypothetical protein
MHYLRIKKFYSLFAQVIRPQHQTWLELLAHGTDVTTKSGC